jgi:hypothetical protein
LRGVVWQPPEDLAQATRELRRIGAAGAEAVRTPLIRREPLLRTADSLRLRLFQDLPAAYLSGEEASARLGDLRWELERALLAARRHPSARHFGVLGSSDTSVPATCAVVRDLAARVRAQGPDGAVAYYETPFIEQNRCTGAADLVLLNALNRDDPQALLRRWNRARTDSSTAPSSTAPPDSAGAAGTVSDSTSVGIGALGQWVDPDVEGLRAPHSPEAQARYFEEHLLPLLRPEGGRVARSTGGSAPGVPESARAQAPGSPLSRTAASASREGASSDSLGTAASVVFAHRWRDAASGGASGDPYGRSYGLHDAQGQPRPALEVVRGLYTARQTVFAFDAGETPPARVPWLMLAGWGLVAVLGVAYAGASRFRELTQRYFTSHSFYRDAVREGRSALGASGLLLLTAVSLCAGLVVTVFLLAVQQTGPFVQMLRGASGETQGWVLTLLQEPWMAVLIVAAFYLVSLVVWAFLLSLVTRRGQPMGVAQTLALVTWPRWPAFLLAAGAVVATTLPLGWMLPVSGALVALWVLASAVAVARTLYDLARMANLSPVAAPALIFLNPVLLGAVLVFFAVLEFLPETTFLWHLATRS